MGDGWASVQARRDAISGDIEKMQAAMRDASSIRKPRSSIDASAMLDQLARGLDQLEAAQAAQDVRLAAQRRRGMAAYEKAREAFAGELAEDRSLTVAASLGLGRPGVRVF